MSGVYVYSSAQDNLIGGSTESEGNTIAYNIAPGIMVEDTNTDYNTISHNSIHDNVGNGILLIDGGNDEIPAPSATSSLSGNILIISGGSEAGANATVEVFKADSIASGEGKLYLGSLTADPSGNFSGTITVTGKGVTPCDAIVMTTTHTDGSTSEFGMTTNASTPVPVIVEEPTSMTFNAILGDGNPPTQTLNISNSCYGTLNWSLSDDASWLSFSPTSGSCTNEIDPVTVSVDISGLSGGIYDAEITITDPNAFNSPKIVPVTLYLAETLTLNLSTVWNGVSCPGDPVESDWSIITEGNSSISLIVEYDTTQQAFVMANDIQFGKSYFIGVTGDTQIELEYYPRESLSVPAKEGWKSLGSILCSIPAGNVTSDPSGQVSLIVSYDNSTEQFVMATTIEPGVGYMAGCLGDCTLSMNCTSPAPPIQRFVSKPTWESILSVQTESDHKELIFGMNHSASDEIDLYDRPMPPLLDTKANITAGWVIENSCFDLFDRSYVKEGPDGEWELSIELEDDGEINWDNLPEAYGFTLSYNDLTVDMHRERSISLPVGKYTLLISFGPKPIIPDRTSLLASYPNPCNPETWIPYELSEETEVKIMIYSSNGNLVRSLDLGHRPAGIYTDRSKAAYWDGRNESGEKVSSGIYFYMLVTPAFSRVRKLLIIR